MIFDMHVHLPGDYDRDAFGQSLREVAMSMSTGALSGEVRYHHPKPGGQLRDPIVGRWQLAVTPVEKRV